ARFSIPDDVQGVELGMTAIVHLAGSTEPAFVVPASALVKQGSQAAVWIVEQGTGLLALRPVAVTRYDQDEVVIASGLKGGEKVVRAGVNRLQAGLPVRPVEGTK
ncbi:MAG: hypothetical protein K2V38_19645, partial [Gemmataceae bacterium]|nr:hypothetical protein [Gemmataceae bacterium]